MKNKKLASAIIALSAASVALAVPASAQGSSPDRATSSPIPGEHVLALTDGTKQEFYIPESVDLTQPFALAQTDGTLKDVSTASVDGTRLTSGDSTSKFSAGGATPTLSTWHSWAAPGDGKWHTSVNGKSIGGSSSAYQAGYKVTIDVNALSGACVDVKGWKQLRTPAGKLYYDSVWKGIGCAGPGGEVAGTVQWGNVLAYEQIQVRSESTLIGSSGMFQ